MHCECGDADRSGGDPGAPSAEVTTTQFLHHRFGDDDLDVGMYLSPQIVIIASSLDADVNIFNFLYLYFYNTYFSIIAYKLATKVL